ncbi:MAG: amyX [Bacillales bacterium]|jgi:pullulanase|nr:amyX [Bacillales bacterium]
MEFNMNDIRAYVISPDEFEVVFDTYLEPKVMSLKENGHIITIDHIKTFSQQHKITMIFKINNKFKMNKVYKFTVDNITVILSFEKYYKTNKFDDEYYYSGDDLGVTFKNNEITLKVWSPTAENIELILFSPNDHSKIVKSMNRSNSGVWTCVININYRQWLYKYNVYRDYHNYEIVDPYAKAVTANGLEGVLVNVEHTRFIQKYSIRPYTKVEAIIYETHIRDFTIDDESGIKLKGKYLGFIESSERKLTTLEYINNLGITHIELLPVSDFEGVDELNPDHYYNWGYNPVNFFVPEGSYSISPNNPTSRILELKTLIEGVHKRGLGIIIDFVFNHVYDMKTSSLEVLVAGYYFRKWENGALTNGSGCGNDLDSENAMSRKLILDCVKYWIEEYNIDGIRLDLMGNLDIKTVSEIDMLCKRLKPNFILIGEGWNLNTKLSIESKAIIENASQLKDVSFFNDQYRDSLKGSSFTLSHRGIGLGSSVTILSLENIILGKLLKDQTNVFVKPSQSVNYIECHDNHTTWDKMIISNYYEDETCRARRQLLMNCILLISHGVAFLHSGQEFCRTKFHDGNSYKSGDDINKIRWKNVFKYHSSIERIRDIISFRKRAGIYKIDNYADIEKLISIEKLDEKLFKIIYNNTGEFGEYEEILIYINLNTVDKILELPKDTKLRCIFDSSNSKCENHKIIESLSLKILIKNKYSP